MKSMIQVPNVIIDNNLIDSSTTLVYVYLKYKSHKNELTINMSEILSVTKLSRDTIIRKLKSLQEMNLLQYQLNRHKGLSVIFSILDQFTQLTKSSISKLFYYSSSNEYVGQSLRLLYFYKKNQNPKLGYSYCSYSIISKRCKISRGSIKTLNNFLEAQKLLQVYLGDYIIKDKTIKRENNRYKILD